MKVKPPAWVETFLHKRVLSSMWCCLVTFNAALSSLKFVVIAVPAVDLSNHLKCSEFLTILPSLPTASSTRNTFHLKKLFSIVHPWDTIVVLVVMLWGVVIELYLRVPSLILVSLWFYHICRYSIHERLKIAKVMYDGWSQVLPNAC